MDTYNNPWIIQSSSAGLRTPEGPRFNARVYSIVVFTSLCLKDPEPIGCRICPLTDVWQLNAEIYANILCLSSHGRK